MRTSAAVAVKPAAQISIRLLLPMRVASSVAAAGPAMPPSVPPAAMKPNRRLAWVREKMSAMKLQNTEMISILNVLTQT